MALLIYSFNTVAGEKTKEDGQTEKRALKEGNAAVEKRASVLATGNKNYENRILAEKII